MVKDFRFRGSLAALLNIERKYGDYLVIFQTAGLYQSSYFSVQ